MLFVFVMFSKLLYMLIPITIGNLILYKTYFKLYLISATRLYDYNTLSFDKAKL